MNKKIVILSDNHLELKDSFSKYDDFEVIGSSASGEEGFKMIATFKPDCVICDLVLKDVDGLTLLERISDLKSNAKVFVYTAFDSDEIIKSASMRGASLYLVKPLSIEIIATRIRSALEPSANIHSDTAAEQRISNVFLTAGIPPHIKGYGFLRSGVLYAIKDPSILGNITKQLYPKIAEEHKTSPSKVERAIRHAIEVAWNRGRIENLNGVFGVAFYTSGDKPTNGEFIALVADRLIQEKHMGKF